MVQAGVELPHITLQHVAVGVHQLAAALPRRSGALAHLTGEAPGYEPPFEQRLHEVTQRVMHHPVSKRRCGDHPPLGFMNLKEPVCAWRPDTAPQLITQPHHLTLPPLPPSLHIRSAALAPPGLFCGKEEVFR